MKQPLSTLIPSSHLSALLALLILGAGTGAATAQTAAGQPSRYPYEFIFRQDPTGEGSFHRIGMFRSQKKSVDDASAVTATQKAAASQEITPDGKTPVEVESSDFWDGFSGQFRANTMLFYSDNILNTKSDPVEDGQIAEFVGASLKWQIAEPLSLNTTYDAAWFRHGKEENAANDFNTRTFRQQLSFERFFLNNKASFSIPLSWQFSEVFSRQGRDRLVGTFTYSTGLELSAFPTSWFIPSFSYTYFLSDPDAGSGKDKHDFNLSATFIPFKGVRFFIIPSVQFSYEDFQDGGRVDEAWTPTLTLSWGPLSWLAFDAVASYTESDSNLDGSSFDALTGTLFARVFWNW